jgi:hypothetical protein
MTTRVLQFIFVASFLVGGNALANRQPTTVSTTTDGAQQSPFGGYSYGESCLFGGSTSSYLGHSVARVNEAGNIGNSSNASTSQNFGMKSTKAFISRIKN